MRLASRQASLASVPVRLAVAADEQRGHVVALARRRRPSSGPSTVSTVASASACMHSRCSTVTDASAMPSRLAAARIDGVRPAPAVVLAHVPAVARGGDGHVGRARPAWLAPGAASICTRQGCPPGRRPTPRSSPPTSTRKFAQARALAATRATWSTAKPLAMPDRSSATPPGCRSVPSARIEVRGAASRRARAAPRARPARAAWRLHRRGAEAPAARPAAPTVGSMAPPLAAAQSQRAGQHFGEFGRQRVPAAGARAVEAADVGVGFPVCSSARPRASSARLGARADGVERQHGRVVERAATRSCPWSGPRAAAASADRRGAARPRWRSRLRARSAKEGRGACRILRCAQGITSSVAA